jgi:hypothetical protein
MAIAITLGTKENIPIDLTDLTGIITTLVGSNPKFDVLDAASAFKINQQAATVSGTMRLMCLCDFSNTTTYPVGLYRLFANFTFGSEVPRLGPFELQIIDTNQLI